MQDTNDIIYNYIVWTGMGRESKNSGSPTSVTMFTLFMDDASKRFQQTVFGSSLFLKTIEDGLLTPLRRGIHALYQFVCLMDIVPQ